MITTSNSTNSRSTNDRINASEAEQAAWAADRDAFAQLRAERHEAPSIYGCPECGGVLWQTETNGLVQFRCHVGHVLSAQALLEQLASAAEAAGWTATRALIDQARLLRQLSAQAQSEGDAETAQRLDEQSLAAQQRSAAFQQLMTED